MAAAWAGSDESLAIARELGAPDRWASAEVLRIAGALRVSYGYAASARPLLEESLALYRQTNDPVGVANALRELGVAALVDDLAAARGLLDQSLAMFLAHGDIWGTGRTLQAAARAAFVGGDYASARRLYQEAFAADEKLRFWPGLAATLSELGRVARLEGNLDRAQGYQDEAIALLRKTGQGTANQIIELGYLALARGNVQEAAPLFLHAATEYSAADDHLGTYASLTGLAEASSLKGDA